MLEGDPLTQGPKPDRDSAPDTTEFANETQELQASGSPLLRVVWCVLFP